MVIKVGVFEIKIKYVLNMRIYVNLLLYLVPSMNIFNLNSIGVNGGHEWKENGQQIINISNTHAVTFIRHFCLPSIDRLEPEMPNKHSIHGWFWAVDLLHHVQVLINEYALFSGLTYASHALEVPINSLQTLALKFI